MKSEMWLLHVWIEKYNKIWNIEIDVYAMFKVKHGSNRIHSIVFAHQVGWFDDKVVHTHPWGLRFKPHNLHMCGQWWYVDCMYLK
jgi:hypothetical protein